MTEEQNAKDNRRSHLRIHDKVFLRVRCVDEEEYKRKVEHILEGVELPFDDMPLQQQLPAITVYLRKLRDKDEHLSKALEVIDDKLNYIISHLNLKMIKAISGERAFVDLSAAGIAFLSNDLLKDNQILQLDIGLIPEHYFFRCFGRVIRIEPVKDKDKYKVGVKFIWIAEADKEKIIEHIFQKQVLQLRLRRHKEEKEQCDAEKKDDNNISNAQAIEEHSETGY